MDPCIVVWLSRNNQPCNRIYYSTVYWRLNLQFPLRLDYGRSPHAYVNQRLKILLELLMMSGMPLETCWAFNERWFNKFYYKVASCWLFLLRHNLGLDLKSTLWKSCHSQIRTGTTKNNWKRKHIYIFIRLLYFSVFRYTSHRPISMADLGASLNHV